MSKGFGGVGNLMDDAANQTFVKNGEKLFPEIIKRITDPNAEGDEKSAAGEAVSKVLTINFFSTGDQRSQVAQEQGQQILDTYPNIPDGLKEEISALMDMAQPKILELFFSQDE